ncbi:hypothetical protein COU54_00710 [Candidatus Pacearchaeota archaeon CG10_big_fil_rev_8_21_14_0_10_31_24]|nr:MAG: hypothetical protein COU54_00710 [Candidatus Pacearchaeota archaeon CG10_big_fil_rev_8_21_14_0_10_31_24]
MVFFGMNTYEQLAERISNSAKLPLEEVHRKVEAKRAKLSGLVSKEGAAQIVAAELGINFENEKMKISELAQSMRRVNTVGKVVEIFPIRSYSKNGREGKVVNLVIADSSSNVKVVFWDTNHIELVESGKIVQGVVLEINNGAMRNNELHLSSFSDVKLSKEKIEEVVTNKVYNSGSFKDVKPGQSLKTRAFIVQVFEPRYFEVCPECGKKATEGNCVVHGSVQGKKRALVNLVLDDGTETLRCVLFGDDIQKLGFSEEEIFSVDLFNARKLKMLGEEKIFSGNVRSNQLYNTTEFNVNGVEDVDVEKVIQELTNKK